MVVTCVVLVPVAVGLVTVVVGWRPWVAWAAVASDAAVVGLGATLATLTVHGPARTGGGGILRADALSAFMVVVIGGVALLASTASARTVAADVATGRSPVRHASQYGVLVQAFVAAMLLAVLAANAGVLWVAVEATTVVTAFLVAHRRTRGALEASWKYLVICSVGIALAFLGTVLTYLAASRVGGHGLHSLDWVSLDAAAHRLDPGAVRLSFALVVFGYGTKAGLAPMHSWLPDAHGEAPAPVSALLSGALLAVAFYAILRFRPIVDAAVGPAFPRALLVTAGLLSLAVAASLLIAQRDLKRLLAYSSIEHMGLVALGAAAGVPAAVAAVLLQILGHGLVKGALFIASGEIVAGEGTSRIDGIRGLAARRPVLGGIFGLGLLALLGMPPFSLFASELAMFRAEAAAGLGWVVVAALAALAVVVLAVVAHGRHLLLGPPGAGPPGAGPSAPVRWTVSVPLITALSLCGLVGVVAWPLGPLLQAASRVVAP